MKHFFAYILKCSDSSYYAGHSDDLDRRIAEHNAGERESYTKTRRPLKLVWSQTFATRDDAKAAEAKIKGWSRAKKEALIAGNWDLIKELSVCQTHSTDQ